VLLAAVQTPARRARFGARQMHSAAGAGDEIGLDRGRSFLLRLGAAPCAPDEPYNEHNEKDEDDKTAHRRII
jgi:hypothetical protein